MSNFEPQTTIEIAALVCGLFAVAGLVVTPAMGAGRFARRLLLANIAMLASMGVAAVFNSTDGPWPAAMMIGWWTLAAAMMVSAMREATGQAVRDDRLAAIVGLALLALTGCALLSESLHPVAIIAPICIGMTAGYGVLSARHIVHAHLARTRDWLQGAFGLAFLASLAHVPIRLFEWAAGDPLPARDGLTYLSMLLVWIAINTGLIMTVALDLLHSVRALSQRDDLTGTLNRRGMASSLDARRKNGGATLEGALVLIDIDHFKTINDTHGHSMGDEVLRWFAEQLRGFMREEDLLVRLGGEEFGLVLPRCDQRDALDVAGRICSSLDQTVHFRADALTIRVTASFGVALLDAASTSIDTSLRKADEALYAAKRTGRNRVIAWSPSITMNRQGAATVAAC